MRQAAVCTALAVSMLAGSATARQPADITIGVPGLSNQTPWAASLGNVVAIAFGAQRPSGRADVYVAVSHDGGGHFGEPVRVNGAAEEPRLGGELPPRVGLAARDAQTPEIVVAYGARGQQGTEIRIARSSDGGRTFAASRPLQASGAAGDRGWHAMALDSRGVAHVMWLDHRGLAAGRAPQGHHGGEAGHHVDAAAAEREAIDGVALAQRSGLYYAGDGSGATSERELVKGVCYCCKVGLATTPRGGLLAAWRQVYSGNIRDIAFMSSTDGGQHFGTPGRVSADEWQLAGCPDDGPALAVDASGAAHIVWPTVIDGPTPEGAIFYASSRDLKTFSARVRVPTLGGPRAMHPQVMAGTADRLYIAWDEVIGGVRRAAVRDLRFDDGGRPEFGPARQLGPGDVPGSYPFLVLTPAGPLALFVSGKPSDTIIRVARL